LSLNVFDIREFMNFAGRAWNEMIVRHVSSYLAK